MSMCLKSVSVNPTVPSNTGLYYSVRAVRRKSFATWGPEHLISASQTPYSDRDDGKANIIFA
eukprot:1215885-Amorphochlora_amoeboformis.AAC.3